MVRMKRSTGQRQAIREVFLTARSPLSAEEALQAARRRRKTLGLATVYRAIHALLKEQMLVAVQLPGDAARYEVRGKRHHHFFRCQACKRIFEIEDCPGDLNRMLPPGFVADAHELILYGRCTDCTR